MQRSLMFADLMADVRISLRGLLRAPLLTLAIVATVGLGLGATTVIFSGINAALLRPLPYPAPERLVSDLHRRASRTNSVSHWPTTSRSRSSRRTSSRLRAYTGSGDGIQRRHDRRAPAGRVVVVDVLAAPRDQARRSAGCSPLPTGVPAVRRQRSSAHAVLAKSARRARQHRRHDRAAERRGSSRRRRHAGASLVRSSSESEFSWRRRWEPRRARARSSCTVLGRLRDRVRARRAAAELRGINRRIFPLWQASYQDSKATWAMADLKTHVVGDVRLDGGPRAWRGRAGAGCSRARMRRTCSSHG